LLGRFYNFPDGTIVLDDVDLNQIRAADVRCRVGVVLQDFHILSDSILDNIHLGNPAISSEQAIDAARIVHADSFIESLTSNCVSRCY
jgi:ATP-binding cassette subfamily B protein